MQKVALHTSVVPGRILQLLSLCLWGWVIFLFTSCIRGEEFENTPQGNFEALWRIIDEQYCYLDYKGVDWDAVRSDYQSYIHPDMDNFRLFEVLSEMLMELKDGHVALRSDYDVAIYWNWYADYPENFDSSLLYDYLGDNYRVASGLIYTILEDNIGYIYYESFSTELNDNDLDQMLLYLAICDGLIVDIRNNGGGMLTNSARLTSRFTNEKYLTGHITHKTGTGRNDFSKPLAVYQEPSSSIRWQKQVAVLTNRHVFSAANDFVNRMHYLPHVTIIGDITGGGAGLPFLSELPNGWVVRFSASPHYDAEMNHLESGIKPDIRANLLEEDRSKEKIPS